MKPNKLALNKFHQLKQKRKRKSTPKKRIRDLERLIEKMKHTNSIVDPQKEQELEKLKNDHEKHKKSQEIKQSIDKKYQKFKFFELKKLSKMER